MTIAEEIAADLLELESEIPKTFTWNGSSFPCAVSSDRRSKRLDSGGFEPEAELVLFVRVELFGSGGRPASKQTLTYAEKSWRIENVVAPAGEPFLRLVCADPNANLAK